MAATISGHGTHSIRSASSVSCGSPTCSASSAAKRWNVASDVPLCGKYVVRWRSGPGRHPVSSSVSRRPASSGVSPCVDAAGRDLPAPRVGREAVPPQQQDAGVCLVLDDDAGRRRRHADDVVLEPAAARQLHVDERQAHPVAVVQRSLAMDRPAHRRDGNRGAPLALPSDASGRGCLVDQQQLTPAALRDEVRAWLDERWPTERPRTEWLAEVVDAGYAVPTWPSAWFGRDLDADMAAVIVAEFRRAGAPGAEQDVHNLWANTVLAFGTEALKQRFIRPLLLDDVAMCLLYSEPGAGSDLAGLQTRAERDGDEWVVTGQKVWTSGAQQADYGMLVARTDWDVPKHRGISFFWCPMKQDGVDVRPIRQITGRGPLQRGLPRRRPDPGRSPPRRAQRGLAGAPDGAGLRALGDGRRGPRPAQRRASRRAPSPTRRRTMPSRSPTARAPRSTSAPWRGPSGRDGDAVLRQAIARVHSLRTVNRWNGQRAKAQLEQGSSSPILSLGKLAMSRHPPRRRPRPATDRRRRCPARRPGQPPRRRRQLPVAQRLLHVDRRGHRPDPAQHHRRARARPAPRAGGRSRRAVPRRRQGDRPRAADQASVARLDSAPPGFPHAGHMADSACSG